MLSVEAEAPATTYETLATKMDVSYTTIAALVGQLSEGRGHRRGLRLLKRQPGSDRRQVAVGTTKLGGAIARRFAGAGSSAMDGPTVQNQLIKAVLPALSVARDRAPSLNLSTLCVLLFIAEHGADFGGKGQPANFISKSTGIVNLPKHFAILGADDAHNSGLGLVKIEQHSLDRRVVLPRLTDQGASMMASIAAALRMKKPAPVRFPKAEKLLKAASPEDVKKFTESDFESPI